MQEHALKAKLLGLFAIELKPDHCARLAREDVTMDLLFTFHTVCG